MRNKLCNGVKLILKSKSVEAELSITRTKTMPMLREGQITVLTLKGREVGGKLIMKRPLSPKEKVQDSGEKTILKSAESVRGEIEQ
jgi:hypothetical protein